VYSPLRVYLRGSFLRFSDLHACTVESSSRSSKYPQKNISRRYNRSRYEHAKLISLCRRQLSDIVLGMTIVARQRWYQSRSQKKEPRVRGVTEGLCRYPDESLIFKILDKSGERPSVDIGRIRRSAAYYTAAIRAIISLFRNQFRDV